MRIKDSVYVIAEAGVNHNGDLDCALELVNVAAASGADAVKFQTFDAKKLASKRLDKAEYQKTTSIEEESQLVMLEKLELPKEWHYALQNQAHSKGIEFISTAFDIDSIEFLASLNIPFFKIPSGDVNNGPLLWHFAKAKKPLVMSTGMATLSEVEEGLAVIAYALNFDQEPASMDQVWMNWSNKLYRDSLKGLVTLLHCTTQYPTPFDEVNLLSMNSMAETFGLEVGYSDHTEGTLVSIAAVARGARIIEKHFTLDRSLPGPDQSSSMEPDELTQMISDIRDVEIILGDKYKSPHPNEWSNRSVIRQQVVAARHISAGSIIEREDLRTARSGRGLAASYLWSMVGKVSVREYEEGMLVEP